MPKKAPALVVVAVSLSAGLWSLACSSQGGTGQGTGGASSTGGAATGGRSGDTGGTPGGTGGAGTGGRATGGSATGGAATGGSASGGASGGTTTGGAGPAGGQGGARAGGQAGAKGGSSPGQGVAGAGAATATGGAGPGGSNGSGASCAGKSYKLCETFEDGAVDGLPTGWTSLKSYGPLGGVGLANDQAHGGKQSLRTTTMSTGGERIQKSLSGLGATATNHWGRLYFKVKTPAPRATGNAYYHITFAALQLTGTPAENRVVDTVEAPDGTIQYIYNLPDDSCCTGSAYNWTHDGAWHCAEWHVDVTAKAYRFFIDSKEVTSLAFTNNANAKMGNYTALGLGAIFYVTPTGPLTAWIDDLAVDDNQIGCQ